MQPTGVLETAKATNPLKALLSYGQSMWLDYIRRDLLTSGKLKAMINDDGLRGMTSNPSIFEKAIGESSLYDDLLKSLASRLILTLRRVMSRLPFETFRTPPISLSRCMRVPSFTMVLSAWKFRPCSL
jgi:hypothetical protein